MQRPDAQHVVDLPFVLRPGEQQDEQRAGHRAHRQRAQRMHQVGAGAHGHQAGQRAVVHEAGVVAAQGQRGQRAAHHGHQRIHGHQTGDFVQRLRAHHVEAEPAHGEDPGAQRQERDVGGRVGAHAAVLAVAVAARAQQQHRRQRDPAAHRVHHHRAGEIVELLAREPLDPALPAEVLVPGHALEERVHEADDDGRGDELRAEARALGNAARDDGRNGRREGQQEEELHQRVAVVQGQVIGSHQEGGAVGHRVADEEVGDGGH